MLVGVGALCWGWPRPSVERILSKVNAYDVARGKNVFEKRCLGCHTGMAPRLSDAVSSARNSHEGLHYLVESVVYPNAHVRPQPWLTRDYAMPYLGLSEDEVGSVVQYLLDEFEVTR